MGEARLHDPNQQKMVGGTIPFFILLPSLVAQNIKYKVPKYKADLVMQPVKRRRGRILCLYCGTYIV